MRAQETSVRPGAASRLLRRRLGWDLAPVEALRLVRADAHPVALLGSWAEGYDVIGSEPLLMRGAPGPLDDVFASQWPSGAVAGARPAVAGRLESRFGGGWIGYLGFGAANGSLPSAGARQLPVGWFGYYDHVVCRDRATGRWYFEALWTADRADALERRFEELSRRATCPPPQAPGHACGTFRLVPSPAEHKAAIRRAVEYIWRGDIFQANICLRAEADFAGDPLDAFCQAVMALQPPFAAFLRMPGGAVASMSPELFLRRSGRSVLSRPIKGTGHRSSRRDQASQQRGDLENSAKNRAENVMIVDLVRNDLSRVCEAGSVTVPRLLEAEPHPGVWHLVSEVRGTLSPHSGDGDLISAAFPPGSVTGAPKVRALEIIGELEATPREVYTGAIGYRSPVAGLELNVAIRTFEFSAGRVWLGVGGGIVADSAEDEEYVECLLKAGPLIRAVGGRLEPGPAADGAATTGLALRPRPAAGVFTSLRVTAGETVGLAGHLARLEASTRQLYGKSLPASLAGELAECRAQRPSGRLRITVRPVGGPLQAAVEVVPLQPPPPSVSLRPVVIPGGLGAHKWHDRRLLADLAGPAALGPGEHLLITDASRDVLETDKANIFAVSGGVLRTPPADGRILPGITRDAILQAARRDDISTAAAPVSMDLLLEASEVFVTNAVYGVLPVRSLGDSPTSWGPGPVARHLAGILAARPAGRPARRPAGGSAAVSSAPRGQGAQARNTATRPVIVLIDNYDSFTYNLAHMLTAAGCQVEVVRNDTMPAEQIAAASPAGVVISPGPCGPGDAGISIEVVRSCAGQIPLLGICLGHQAIAAAFGARIIAAPRPVHGQVSEITHDARGVLTGIPQRFRATRYHSLLVDEDSLPPALTITARAGQLPMALRHVTSPIEGVQFHPESILTTYGETLIRNFVQTARATE